MKLARENQTGHALDLISSYCFYCRFMGFWGNLSVFGVLGAVFEEFSFFGSLTLPASQIKNFFRGRLDQMIDLRHPLAVLSTNMPW